MHFEDGVKLGDQQHVLDTFGHAQQLHRAAGVRDTRESRNQLTDTRAVHIRHFAKIQQNLLISLRYQIAHRLAYEARSFADSNPAGNIDHRYVAHLPGIRLHILHHAVEGPIFGLEMAEEPARHGYRISLGTLYPLLHGLGKKGYLRSVQMRKGQSLRKVYRATPVGRKAIKAMRVKVGELFGELNETVAGCTCVLP